MSLHRKMLIFTSIIVIVPMVVVLFLSNTILDNQINQSAEEYLKEAFVIANNLLTGRLDEMGRLSASVADSGKFREKLKNGETDGMRSSLEEMRSVYSYIDFYILYDGEKRLLADSPAIKNANAQKLSLLLGEAGKRREALTSVESFDLDDLFSRDTAEYQRSRVYVGDEHRYLGKCLAAVSVFAISGDGADGPAGYLVIGSVLNNNGYFPSAYSKSMPHSYLAISTDGIRVASNITSPQIENYIGSPTPVPVSTLEGINNVYFGRKNFGGEIHVYLDKVITSYDGKNVGIIGVGIPQQKFLLIANTQKSIIIVVPILFLAVMLFLLRYFATKVARPIIKATQLANQISQGNTDVDIEESALAASDDESILLLRALKKMADTLKKNKEDIIEYLKELEKDREEQQYLSRQLISMNENLEKKVQIRTQDLREAIETLKKSGQYKSQFLSNMSHELRTPLSSIISCTEILKGEIFGPLNGKQSKYVENIWKSSGHLQVMINDILDTAKIEAGKMTLEIGNYSLSEIIEESLSIVESLAERKQIKIAMHMDDPDLIVKIDCRKTKQALCNILSNSIKFTPEGGEIGIGISRVGDFIRIVIQDNGIGIREEDQRRVFHEFEQADSSYERRYGGTGLGLPLAKKFVELQGGNIYLTSQVGKGTKVVITLPIDIDSREKDGPNIL
ncbi:MAG TPA: two-component sensor histidine kinase [Ruminococcaceae bacterium]|nr:two-component sensor histidine kinase [Oscillospiraceae bacterium]